MKIKEKNNIKFIVSIRHKMTLYSQVFFIGEQNSHVLYGKPKSTFDVENDDIKVFNTKKEAYAAIRKYKILGMKGNVYIIIPIKIS